MEMIHRDRRVLEIAVEVQARIVDAMDRMSATEIESSCFAQVGLRDGAQVVESFLGHGELGLAFEHVAYMISETQVPIAAESAQFLIETAAALGLRAPRLVIA